MKRQNLIILVPFLILASGCTTKPTEPLPQPEIPASLLQPCPQPPDITPPANMGTLANHALDLLDLYTECAIVHDGLIRAVGHD